MIPALLGSHLKCLKCVKISKKNQHETILQQIGPVWNRIGTISFINNGDLRTRTGIQDQK
jgi:hypothetical protein